MKNTLRETRLPPHFVATLISAYRNDGYRSARLDPLELSPNTGISALNPLFRELDIHDQPPDPQAADISAADISELEQKLHAVYCGPLGLDCSGVRAEQKRAWLFERLEAAACAELSRPQRVRVLDRLIAAQSWETHIQRAYSHVKRFSLEGCESLVPLLDALIEQAGGHGVEQLFLGMSHRGRLNVLVNVMNIAPSEMIERLSPAANDIIPYRDLSYHLGCTAQIKTTAGEVTLYLAHNPSHLQSVHPVVCGLARAYQDNKDDIDGRLAVPVLIHGDAAFSGQGVVMEALNLSQTRGFSSGGSIHIIVNNQIGFTTSDPRDARSSPYCTDIARMIEAPVLHVNADYPEHVVLAAQIALDYRMQFGADIVLDLIGYRRGGHSEQDITALTQPKMQAAIDRHAPITELYARALIEAGDLTAAELETLQENAAAFLRTSTSAAMPAQAAATAAPANTARPSRPGAVQTAVPHAQLHTLVQAMTTLPDGFVAHNKIAGMIEQWHELVREPANPVDWRFAENMAYASLLAEGQGIRISGMDVGRGTFMHRQAVWHDQNLSNETPTQAWIPLKSLATAAARFDIYNSPLAEEAVLGFEYGYSVASRRKLVIWEAQFGDFVNGAQVMVDQYVSSGESKWGCRSALAILLPHGYEGVGPEHSSACLSRFLQLCAEDNMRLCIPSTSAQWFHLLRQQALSDDPKPLVAMTPKALLYANTASHAALSELIDGRFAPVLGDAGHTAPQQVRRVVLCSGKFFHDLAAALAAAPDPAIALVRIEQLYPFPLQELAAQLQQYGALEQLVWAQEEHMNQGPWQFLREYLETLLPAGAALHCVCRPPSAAGATASGNIHRQEQRELVAATLRTA
jgi:2-oxoglutarate dehydrogenase E1 component